MDERKYVVVDGNGKIVAGAGKQDAAKKRCRELRVGDDGNYQVIPYDTARPRRIEIQPPKNGWRWRNST